jgi:hypothetical protein
MCLDPPHGTFNDPDMYKDRCALHFFETDLFIGIILVVQDLAGKNIGKSVSCNSGEFISGCWEGFKLELEDVHEAPILYLKYRVIIFGRVTSVSIWEQRVLTGW